MQEKIHTYTVKFEPDSDGGFVVTVPALPGVVTRGNDLAHAQEMAKEVITLHLEALAQENFPIPSDIRYEAVRHPKFFEQRVVATV